MIRALLIKADKDPQFLARILNDPEGVSERVGLTLTREELERASTLQADIWAGQVDPRTAVARIFLAAPGKPARLQEAPPADPYLRREPWHSTG